MSMRSAARVAGFSLALAFGVWSGGGGAAISAPIASLADIVERVSPAVVSLTVRITQGQRSGMAVGSGFVIDPTGYVVTNNHVVANATDIEVRFADDRKFKAKVIGRDPATDVALIKIDATVPLPSVRFVADDRKVRVGDWVLAVGNPYGLGGTVTAGIVSARGRDEVGSGQFTDYFQLDAAINQGNSGGPTFDMQGRVIGMNTLGYVSSGGDRATGIGFAIPASTIQRVVEDLKSSGTVSRGFLGVQIETLSEDAAKALGLPNANGALVTEVIEGSPAQKGGIRRGDVILRLNGQAVKDNRELSRRIAALQVGQTATFTIWRDNQQITITVTVAKRENIALLGLPGAAPEGQTENAKAEIKLTSLGVALQTITADVRASAHLGADVGGVLITHVDPDGDAAARGLRPGDRILAVSGDDVTSLVDVNLAIEQARSLKRDVVLLDVINQQGAKVHVPVKLIAR